MATRRRGPQASTTDPGYESRMQDALDGLNSGKYPTVAQAALKNLVCYCVKFSL